ncbi:class I SAM-dependent methyltransferase [Vibrio variabilis]|uniref:class I SAM-dependent methyltransferase n=1 Tax=Vibrio variabilis TaxID=990271 RepID=UPI0023B860C3|nr:class I SAM-dependent methyltransferase [Vibrio variabilis]
MTPDFPLNSMAKEAPQSSFGERLPNPEEFADIDSDPALKVGAVRYYCSSKYWHLTFGL